jgi:hypothetical protein
MPPGRGGREDMRIVGIDPGKDGYIVLLENGVFKQAVPMPVVQHGNKRELSPESICEALLDFNPDRVYIEQQQPFSKQGVVSTGSTMYGMGLLVGICVGKWIRVLVRPQKWQKAVGIKKKDADDTKNRAILKAQELFPHVDLRRTERCKKPHDGFADALLIAYFGWLRSK